MSKVCIECQERKCICTPESMRRSYENCRYGDGDYDGDIPTSFRSPRRQAEMKIKGMSYEYWADKIDRARDRNKEVKYDE